VECRDINRPPGFKDPNTQPDQNTDDKAKDSLPAQGPDLNDMSQQTIDDEYDLMDRLEGNDVYDFLDNASDLSQQSTLVGGDHEDLALEGLLRDEIASPTPVITQRKQMLSSKPPPDFPDLFTPSPSRRASGPVLKCKRCGAKRSTPWPADNRCERCNLKQQNNNNTRSPYFQADM
jgi:hypothetical protein